MDKNKLVQSLIDSTNALPHRNAAALDAVIKRASMIIRNVFGEKSSYIASLEKIRFGPMIWSTGTADSVFDRAWDSGKREMLNLFNAMREELELFSAEKREESRKDKVRKTNRVFIVHGHDKEMQADVALMLTEIGLKPIILHKQPDMGKTIIEKFEKYSDVGYAVVLLSPDNWGYSKKQKPEKKKLRARQNVIFELGFFLGELGRERVLVIHRKVKNFEIPSDYAGVLFKPYDRVGEWKSELVKELRACGYVLSSNKP